MVGGGRIVLPTSAFRARHFISIVATSPTHRHHALPLRRAASGDEPGSPLVGHSDHRGPAAGRCDADRERAYRPNSGGADRRHHAADERSPARRQAPLRPEMCVLYMSGLSWRRVARQRRLEPGTESSRRRSRPCSFVRRSGRCWTPRSYDHHPRRRRQPHEPPSASPRPARRHGLMPKRRAPGKADRQLELDAAAAKRRGQSKPPPAPKAKSAECSTNSLELNIDGSRCCAARATRRLRSLKSIVLGSVTRASGFSLVIVEKARSSSPGLLLYTN